MGAVGWLWLGRKSLGPQKLLLATMFVGGFVFHLFWEAMCQFAMPYFFLLIPMAAAGLLALADQAEIKLDKMRNKSKTNAGTS